MDGDNRAELRLKCIEIAESEGGRSERIIPRATSLFNWIMEEEKHVEKETDPLAKYIGRDGHDAVTTSWPTKPDD